MDHNELMQAFYNLLAQFQNEQIHVNTIATAVTAHAVNIENADKVVRKIMVSADEYKIENYKRLTEDMDAFYQRLQAEKSETNAHQTAGIESDQKRLYNEITQERKVHVEESSKIVLDKLEAYAQTMDVQVNELQTNAQDTTKMIQLQGVQYRAVNLQAAPLEGRVAPLEQRVL